MRPWAIFLTGIVTLISLELHADNAPVTTAGSVLNAAVSPAITVFPVTVTNFIGIGSITLKCIYNSSVLSYQSASVNAAFTGLTVTVSPPGTILIQWTGTSGISLPDQDVLLNLSFGFAPTIYENYSALTWDTTACQYTKYTGGAYISLNDIPANTYYFNGVVTNHAAPVTSASFVTNATAGQVAIPIKVNGFTNIGSISLTLEYDPNVLTYLSFIQNVLIPGAFVVGSQPGTAGTYKVVMAWYGSSPTLPDGSAMLTLYFNYSNTPGQSNYSDLTWNDNGPSCFYSDMQYRDLYDDQTSYFYINGLVACQLAPQALLPSITNAAQGSNLTIPVKVNNFTNVKSFTLSFEYDPAVITYSSFLPNVVFGSALTVTNNPIGSNGKRKLVMAWSGTLLTLSNGTTILTLTFSCNSGTSLLKWVTDASSCHFNDAINNSYYDFPKSSYYFNGLVTSHVAPITVAWYASPAVGTAVTVPVKVFHFSNIGNLTLTLDYDPAVLTFQNATLVPSIGGSFSSSTPGPGQVVMSWAGMAASLPDSSDLVNLTFLFNGGASPLAWYDNGNSCKYTEEGSGLPSLYDQPQSSYYVNGYIGPTPLITNFSAGNLTPEVNATVTFTDLTTGAPTGWNWIFNPSNIVFVNGTSSSSQNPNVQFTLNGAFSITLITSRGSAEGIRIKTNYIHAGTPGLWTGITSTDWNTASNWHNYLIPDNTTSVQIPGSAPNWPLFDGDLVLGTQCKNMTIAGSSQITVTGNFTIGPGSILTFTGSGTLKAGGNWTDLGTFTPGTGTIDFTGSIPGTIISVGSPPVREPFYNLKVTKIGPASLTIPGTIIVSGDLVLQ